MNSDRLFALYDRVAEAQDAVGRLRRFVLDLAVRGKLVGQDPADEPASELLKRIAVEKARLVKAGEIRKPRALKPLALDVDESSLSLPKGWEWAPLAGISYVTMGQSPPGDTYNRSGDGVPLINGPVEFTAGPFGRTIVNQFTTAPTKLCQEGDLLICVRGSTTGRTNVAAFRACIGRGVAAICSSFDDEFIRLFLWKVREDIISMGRGIAFPSVSKKQLENLAIPLPPLAEQRRIVAKVDDLMALCDRLEEARTVREDTRDRLTKASLTRLSAADTDVPTFRSHARFAVDALPALTARTDQVKHLRQTILNLAVRGKLVEQDPADEPASELLKRIAAEKARMVKAGEIRKPKRMPVLDTDELPFCLPHKWAWTRLFEMSRKIHYGFTASANRMVEAVRLLRITDIQDNRVDWLSVPGCEIEENVLPKFRLEKGDVLIARTGGTVGKSFLVQDVPVTAVFASYLIRIQGSHEVNDRYLKLFLESPTYWTQLRDGARGAGQPNVNGQTLGRIAVPVPPLAEQLRIVTKVDQLMALCDRLEDGLSAVDGTRNGLLESLLHESLGSHEAMINGMIGGVARVGT